MANEAICGIKGKVTFDTNVVVLTKQWTIDGSIEVLRLAYHQQTALKKKGCGPYDWKGTVDLDFADDFDPNGQKAMLDKFITGVVGAMILQLDDGLTISGNVIIQAFSANSNAAPGNVAGLNYSYEGTGDFTVAVPV